MASNTSGSPRRRAATRNPYAVEGVTPAAKTPGITEELLQERLLKRCRELDLFTQHIPRIKEPTRRGTSVTWRTAYHRESTGKGWLDTYIVGETEILVVELKVGRNTLKPEQKEWKRRLEKAGQRVVIWTEKDWESGVIEAELCRLAGGVAIGRCKDGGPSWEYQPGAFGGFGGVS